MLCLPSIIQGHPFYLLQTVGLEGSFHDQSPQPPIQIIIMDPVFENHLEATVGAQCI